MWYRTFAGCLIIAGAASAGEARTGAAAPPPGFSLARFAGAPESTAPTAIAVSPDGSLVFVAEDPANVRCKTSGAGRIHLLRDSDGDGSIDQRTVFADKVNGARGMCYHDGTLFVMAVPTLSALRDTNGDGIADVAEVLVSGFGEKPEERTPDHSINGVHLAIDGWLYIAVGDQGVPTPAEGKDGRTLVFGEGGIVRVRPDGSGIEAYAHGQRNIYDVGIAPTMDLFVRENTNDGRGWNTRFMSPFHGSDGGYPARFKDFADECLPIIADLGGGSGCGGVWCDESAAPPSAQGFLSCDWGKGAVFVHRPKPQGAGFADANEVFVTLKRPVDADVDARGRVYIADWGDHKFGLAKKPHGDIWRLVPERPAPAPGDLGKADDAELVKHVVGGSQRLRVEAQRVLLRRGAKAAVVQALASAVEGSGPIAGRVAALWTVAQLDWPGAVARIAAWSKDAALREYALRALADRGAAQEVPLAPFIAGLSDQDHRVRLQSSIGIGRLGRAEAAEQLLPLVRDADAIVQHAALGALRKLDATDVYLRAAQSSDAAVAAAALRVLRGCRTPQAVAGVVALIAQTSEAARLTAIAETLAFQSRVELFPRKGWWAIKPTNKGAWYAPVEWEGSAAAEEGLRAIAAKGGELTGAVAAVRVRFGLKDKK